MTAPLTRAQTDALAGSLRSALALIRTDELSASTATTYRIEGALAALDTVLGVSGDDLLAGLIGDHPGGDPPR